jgi:hypothetical protein
VSAAGIASGSAAAGGAAASTVSDGVSSQAVAAVMETTTANATASLAFGRSRFPDRVGGDSFWSGPADTFALPSGDRLSVAAVLERNY